MYPALEMMLEIFLVLAIGSPPSGRLVQRTLSLARNSLAQLSLLRRSFIFLSGYSPLHVSSWFVSFGTLFSLKFLPSFQFGSSPPMFLSWSGNRTYLPIFWKILFLEMISPVMVILTDPAISSPRLHNYHDKTPERWSIFVSLDKQNSFHKNHNSDGPPLRSLIRIRPLLQVPLHGDVTRIKQRIIKK